MGVAFWSIAMAENTCGLAFSEDVVTCTIATDGALVLGFVGGVMAEAVEPLAQQIHPKTHLREHRAGDETDFHSAD